MVIHIWFFGVVLVIYLVYVWWGGRRVLRKNHRLCQLELLFLLCVFLFHGGIAVFEKFALFLDFGCGGVCLNFPCKGGNHIDS